MRIEERTLSIGFGIKRAPECEERVPELFAFRPSLSRGHTVPLSPLGTDKVLRVDLPKTFQATFHACFKRAGIVPLRDAARCGFASGSMAYLGRHQFGELRCDTCHRLFCGTQAAPRGKEGADFTESFIRRPVHNWDEPLTR